MISGLACRGTHYIGLYASYILNENTSKELEERVEINLLVLSPVPATFVEGGQSNLTLKNIMSHTTLLDLMYLQMGNFISGVLDVYVHVVDSLLIAFLGDTTEVNRKITNPSALSQPHNGP